MQELSDNLTIKQLKQNYISKYSIPTISLEYSSRFNLKIITPRLIIQSIRNHDLKQFHSKLWNNPNVRKTIEKGKIKTIQEAEQRIKKWQKRWDSQNIFSGMSIRLKTTNQFIGYAVMGFGDTPNTSQIAYQSGEQYWNNTYAFQVGGAIIFFLIPIIKKLGFKVNQQKQVLKKVVSTALVTNIASQKLLKKLGFQCIKKDFKHQNQRYFYELNVQNF